MGMCMACLSGEKDDYQQPSPETRRRQQAEAATKRQQDAEGRGVKDPAALKRKQQRREEMEKRADVPDSEGGMRWQVG